MNVHHFLQYQCWLKDFPLGSLRLLKKERDNGGVIMTCILQECNAAFSVLGESISFASGLGEISSNGNISIDGIADTEVWIVESRDRGDVPLPAALLMRINEGYYFVDHTMLKSLSIQKSKGHLEGLSPNHRRPGTTTSQLRFCWPLNLDMIVSFTGRGDEGVLPEIEKLKAAVGSMSKKLTRDLSTHALFYPLWKGDTPFNGDVDCCIRGCIDQAVLCGSQLTFMSSLPASVPDIYAANNLVNPQYSGSDLVIDDRVNAYCRVGLRVAVSMDASSVCSSTMNEIEVSLAKKRKSMVEQIDIVLTSIFPDNQCGPEIDAAVRNLSLIALVVPLPMLQFIHSNLVLVGGP